MRKLIVLDHGGDVQAIVSSAISDDAEIVWVQNNEEARRLELARSGANVAIVGVSPASLRERREQTRELRKYLGAKVYIVALSESEHLARIVAQYGCDFYSQISSGLGETLRGLLCNL